MNIISKDSIKHLFQIFEEHHAYFILTEVEEKNLAKAQNISSQYNIYCSYSTFDSFLNSTINSIFFEDFLTQLQSSGKILLDESKALVLYGRTFYHCTIPKQSSY